METEERCDPLGSDHLSSLPPDCGVTAQTVVHHNCKTWLETRAAWQEGRQEQAPWALPNLGFCFLRHSNSKRDTKMLSDAAECLAVAMAACLCNDAPILPALINGWVTQIRLDRLTLVENESDPAQSKTDQFPYFLSFGNKLKKRVLDIMEQSGEITEEQRKDYKIADFSILICPPGTDPQELHCDGDESKSFGGLYYTTDAESTVFNVLKYTPYSTKKSFGKTQQQRDGGRHFSPLFYHSWPVKTGDMAVMHEDKHHFGPGSFDQYRIVFFIKVATKIDVSPEQILRYTDTFHRYGDCIAVYNRRNKQSPNVPTLTDHVNRQPVVPDLPQHLKAVLKQKYGGVRKYKAHVDEIVEKLKQWKNDKLSIIFPSPNFDLVLPMPPPADPPAAPATPASRKSRKRKRNH
jgi:hypothetical protein